MFRITTQQQFNNSIDNMLASQSKLNNLQEQSSSGKRVLNPADDPVAAAQIVKLEREMAQYDKYDINIKVTDRRLTLQETVQADLRTSLNRIKELIVQGSTGTLTDSDRASVANSMKTETELMVSLMNTQDSQGEYLFAGSKGKTKPYQLQTDGSYKYFGDDGQRNIQVSNELFVPSNDSGQYLFEAVTDDLKADVRGTYASQLPVSTPLVSNVTFDNKAAQEKFTEATKNLGDLKIIVTAGPNAYSIQDSSGNPVNDFLGTPITAIPYTPGGQVDVLGMKFNLSAAPGVFAGADQNVLHIEPERKNIIDAVQDYVKALEKPITNQTERDALATATTEIFAQWDQASERNIESVTRLGTRQKFLDQVRSSNADFTLFTKTSLSSIQDINATEVFSQFKLEEVTLQAAQAVFGRVSALSLFDHIQN